MKPNTFNNGLQLQTEIDKMISESKLFEDEPVVTRKPDSRDIPKPEVRAVGSLLDTKDFNPDDPEIIVSGFGTYSRSALQLAILNRIHGVYKIAAEAAKSEPHIAYRLYNNIRILLDPKTGVIPRLVQANLDAANQLDAMRAKGGKRNVIIPKQK